MMRVFVCMATILAAAMATVPAVAGSNAEKAVAVLAEQKIMDGFIDDATIQATVGALVAAHGEVVRALADRGVHAAAMFWRAQDGTPSDFRVFCEAQFVADPDARVALLERFRKNMEALVGYRVALTRTLREETDLDALAPLPVDLQFATLDPFDHRS